MNDKYMNFGASKLSEEDEELAFDISSVLLSLIGNKYEPIYEEKGEVVARALHKMLFTLYVVEHGETPSGEKIISDTDYEGDDE